MSAAANEAPPVARPREIEEPLNLLLIHPLARTLLPLAARSGVHPNLVSLAGIGFGALAAPAFHAIGDWRMALLGLAAMIGWHVCDGLDGLLARATGRTSSFGRFLDGFCDYSVFVLVYVSLAIALMPDYGAIIWGVAATAGAAHAVQSAWYEAQRELYIRRCNGEFAGIERVAVGGILERLYNSGQSALMAGAARMDAALRANPQLLPHYRRRLERVVALSGLLGPTGRTLAIAIACVVALPELFWLWEIVALLPALVLLDSWRQRRERGLIG